MTRADDVALLRQAADVMTPFGPVHAAMAEGLRADATRLEAGEIPEDIADLLALARTYAGDET